MCTNETLVPDHGLAPVKRPKWRYGRCWWWWARRARARPSYRSRWPRPWAARWSTRTPCRCTSGWMWPRPRRRPRSATACRTTCWTSWTRARAATCWSSSAARSWPSTTSWHAARCLSLSAAPCTTRRQCSGARSCWTTSPRARPSSSRSCRYAWLHAASPPLARHPLTNHRG